MQKKWTSMLISGILILLFFIVEWVVYKEFSFFYTTNVFFYPAAFFLIIGLVNLVILSGSFDFFYFSIQKAARKLNKKQHPDEEDSPIPQLSSLVGRFHFFFIKIGLSLLIVSILALIGYYLFEQ